MLKWRKETSQWFCSGWTHWKYADKSSFDFIEDKYCRQCFANSNAMVKEIMRKLNA